MTQDKPTIEDVLKKESEKYPHLNELGRAIFVEGGKFAASLNRQGWTSDEEQDELWSEVMKIIFPVRPIRGLNIINVWDVLKSKYQLMPLPNKPSI